MNPEDLRQFVRNIIRDEFALLIAEHVERVLLTVPGEPEPEQHEPAGVPPPKRRRPVLSAYTPRRKIKPDPETGWRDVRKECPKCHRSGLVLELFGLRTIRGAIKVQSWCTNCRA